MSLRSKIALILAGVAVAYVAIDVVLLRAMVYRPFDALERREASADLERVQRTLQGLEQDLAVRARALAVRGDVARYLRGEDDALERDALDAGALERADLNLLYLCDPEGRVVFGRAEDSDTRRPLSIREFPGASLGQLHPVLLTRRGGTSTEGMLITERGPMLVAAHAVADPADGREVGVAILGRLFDRSLKDVIHERLGIEVDVWPIVEGALPEEERVLVDEVSASPVPVARPFDEHTLDVYSTYADIKGAPTLLLKGRFPREVSAGGRQVFEYASLSTVASALLILLVLLRLLQGIVVRPLARLTAHAVEIGRTEDATRKVAMDRGDEIGQLSREFDRTMEKLERSREQVVRTARMAGMSEIATGVLHNVGNVLNSVNVSANVVKKRAEALAVGDLAAMLRVLEANADDLGRFLTEDPRGKQLVPFVADLHGRLGGQRDSVLREVGELLDGLEHIMDLVRNQQGLAGKSSVIEPAQLGEQVDAAVRMCRLAYGGLDDVEIVREYEALPPVPIDKHKLMEILVNVVQNASQVLREHEVADPRIVLRVRRSDEGDVRVEVEDNGPGIPTEDLARIFHHGFTTRRDGHGFGLHVSANAATEMRARLWAESEGLGRGARFVLAIPAEGGSAAAAA